MVRLTQRFLGNAWLVVGSAVALAALVLVVAGSAQAWWGRSGGYHGQDQFQAGGPTYNFVDISGTGTQLVVGEDGTPTANSDPVALPGWTFPFFGSAKSSFVVNNNGVLIFSTDRPTAHPIFDNPIPGHPWANDFVSGFWGHVRGKPVHYQFFTAPQNHVIVQWTDHDTYYVNCVPNPLWTFQIKLFQDGKVEYHYRSLNRVWVGCGPPYFATIGVENSAGTLGVHYPTASGNFDMTNYALRFWANRAPVNTGPTTASVLEDASVAIALTFTDADGDTAITWGTVTPPTNGVVTYVGATATYTPAANFCGTDTFTYRPSDWWEPGNSRTVTVTVTCVNDAPVVTGPTNPTVLEDAPLQSVPWATLSPGPANEASQTLTVSATTTNPGLFQVQPSINPGGVLTYQPAANANGVASVTATIRDSGGTANGGVNTTVRSFTITVTAVNDAPLLTLGPNIQVAHDAGPQSMPFATGIAPGPSNEGTQVLSIATGNNLPAAFYAQPQVALGGTLTFTPQYGQSGVATVTVTLRDDGGTANGGVNVTTATFTIEVLVAPIAGDDTLFVYRNTVDNPLLVLANDLHPLGQPLTLDPAGFTLPAQGTLVLAGGGTSFLYTPPNGFTGPLTFTYTARDPQGRTDVATVNLDVREPPPSSVAIQPLGGACAGFPASFRGTLTAPGVTSTTSWTWTVGALSQILTPGGMTSDVVFTIPTAGSHTLGVAVLLPGLPDPVTAQTTVNVETCVGASAAFDVASMEGLRVTFSQLSSGALSYLWSFGDGQTSTLPAPVHTYAGPGNYLVQLTIQGATNHDSISRSIGVGFGAPPAVTSGGYSALPAPQPAAPALPPAPVNRPPVAVLLRGFDGARVLLDASASHDPDGDRLDIAWRQLQGQQVTLQRQGSVASFTPPADGRYVFELIVDDGHRESTDTVTVDIESGAQAPTAGFRSTAEGLSVRFGDESTTGAGARYRWDFGDGQTSSDRAPRHTFAAAGAYVVRLTVEEGGHVSESVQVVRVAGQAESQPAERDLRPLPGTQAEPASAAVGGVPDFLVGAIVAFLGTVALAVVGLVIARGRR